MLGCGGDELYGKDIAEFTRPDDVPADKELNEELRAGNLDRYRREKRYLRKDGEAIWVQTSVSVVRGTRNEPRYLVGMVQDVTERRRTEEALKKSESRFRALVENAGDAFFVHDLDGGLVDANRWACDSLGYTREELLGLSVTDVEMNMVPQSLEEMWESLVPGEPITVEGVHRRKDGTTFPVEVRVGAFESDGRPLMLALARDVTERRKAQEALEESEARFRQLFEHSVDALFVHDASGRILDCNSETCRSLGYTREELLRLSVKDVATDLLDEEEKEALGDDTLWGRAMRGSRGRP